MDAHQKLLEENFSCLRCHQCCKQPGCVYLEKGEEDRIANFFAQDPREFVNQFCDLTDRTRLTLKKLPDESCVFLTASGCSIHSVKPKQCVDFPVRWRTPRSLDYCEGMKKVIRVLKNNQETRSKYQKRSKKQDPNTK